MRLYFDSNEVLEQLLFHFIFVVRVVMATASVMLGKFFISKIKTRRRKLIKILTKGGGLLLLSIHLMYGENNVI